MRYLLERGYDVIPVRPRDCDEVLGIPCVASLDEIDGSVDLVDVFRRPEYAPGLAREAVTIGAKAVWLQMGIVSEDARKMVEKAGLDYVEDACTKLVHMTYLV